MKTSFLIIVVGLIILSSVIFVAIWNSIPKECDDKCEHERRAIEAGISGRGTIDPFERHSEFDISKVTTMPPNTMEIFYYSNTDDTTDFFKTFLLIRLPVELGGDADDISSFRAYSSVSVSSHCLSKYWPHEGRMRIEDPCHGSMYRVIDGLLTDGPKPLDTNVPITLPHLDLSLDENGSLYVEPPKWTLDENGVISEGRVMTLSEIRTGSQFLIDSFEKLHPKSPKIPLDFAGHILTRITMDGNRAIIKYSGFTSISSNLHADIGLATSNDQSLMNSKLPNYQWMQIGETKIRLETNPNASALYGIQFIKDGYNFTFHGIQDLEFAKKEIISNYFSEFNYTDIIEGHPKNS